MEVLGKMWLVASCFLILIPRGGMGQSGYDPDAVTPGTFPDDFAWGVATSAYQVEGAWDKDGRAPSIWDIFTLDGSGHVKDGSNGNVACDQYSHYKEDVQLIKSLNVKYYRFSISWSRVLPDGTEASLNQAGINYYKNLVTELKANGIEPMVTLYHWDLPQALHDRMGGWQNATIVQYFGAYARVMFREFGDQVKFWITLNEPYIVAWLGYGSGTYAPGIKEPATAPYTVGHNQILAHTEAFHIYDQEFRLMQKGRIGITMNSDWLIPKTQSQADIDAAERQMQFILGWFANPIFGSNGDYPDVMKHISRLPVFTPAEKQRNKGAADFFGLNHYTSKLVSDSPRAVSDPPSYFTDSQTHSEDDPSWRGSSSAWLKVNPSGMRNILNWIKTTYNNPEVYVTENGVSDCGTLQDQARLDYYKSYINNILRAITTDGCNVKGYMAWSLMDNFGWISGYTERFGLVGVNFERDDRPRTVKDSGFFFADLVKNNGFPSGWDTSTYVKADVAERNMFLHSSFPDGFAWGAATAAYQVEGAWNEDEVCLVKEQTIFKRNLVVSGDILHVTEISSPLMCMKECLAFPVCGSVNIYPDSLRCELMLHNSTDELVTVVTSSDGMTIDAGDIPQEYAGECVNHSCLLTEKCISRQSRGFVCFQYDFCDGLPASVVNAIYTIDRSRGVPIATYSCLPGAGYVGGVPKSVCHPLTKTWSVAGIVCSTTLPDGCGTPPALPVPHNVTRPYNETAYLAAYTCLDLSGQTAVDHCPMTRCTGIEQWTSGASISCSVKDCYISSTSYDGQVTCTNTGKTCQRWDQQTPHTHEYFTDRSDLHNYCRVSGSVMPWCYTTDPASRWEACPVPQC